MSDKQGCWRAHPHEDMDDAQVWLILANGLAAQGSGTDIDVISDEADLLLAEYKKRFDPDYFKGANDE